MFSLRPLAKQEVYFTDSTLGRFKNWGGKGLWVGYGDLVRAAFKEEWWGSRQCTNDGYTQMEANFGLFWGISMLMYQRTLVSDDTPLDRFLAGDATAISQNAQVGLNVFTGNWSRDNRPSRAATFVTLVQKRPPRLLAKLCKQWFTEVGYIMLRGPRFNIPTFYDRGYYNTVFSQPTSTWVTVAATRWIVLTNASRQTRAEHRSNAIRCTNRSSAGCHCWYLQGTQSAKRRSKGPFSTKVDT